MGPVKQGVQYNAAFVDLRADGSTTVPDMTGLTVKEWTVTDAKTGEVAGVAIFNPNVPTRAAYFVYGNGPAVTVNIEFSNGSRVSSPPIQVIVNPINRQTVTA